MKNSDFVFGNLQCSVEAVFVYWVVTRDINLIAGTSNVRTVSRKVIGGDNEYSERKIAFNNVAHFLVFQLLRRSVVARKLLFIFFAIFSVNTISFASDARVKCPAAQDGRNIFNTSQISKNSVVAIERRDGDYPIVLVMYSQADSGLCNKSEFARYSIEGSVPTVESLFFYKLDGEVNLFTIVSWSINNRGEGTYGTLYQVYAYRKSNDGSLKENKKITENNEMAGMEGYNNWQQSTFPYKTAADVKRALSHFHDRS